MLARFRRHYPGEYWAPGRYQTSDGIIPFGMFWILYRRIDTNLAYERLSEVRGILGALGVGFGKSGAPLPESIRVDQKAAYVAE